MAQYAVTGTPAAPMPVRVSAWAIYEVFETGDGEQVFVVLLAIRNGSSSVKRLI